MIKQQIFLLFTRISVFEVSSCIFFSFLSAMIWLGVICSIWLSCLLRDDSYLTLLLTTTGQLMAPVYSLITCSDMVCWMLATWLILLSPGNRCRKDYIVTLETWPEIGKLFIYFNNSHKMYCFRVPCFITLCFIFICYSVSVDVNATLCVRPMYLFYIDIK